MLSAKFELLQKNYDIQVRKECNKSKYLLESCFQEHFEDQYVCKPYMEAFEKCIEEFTLKFKKERKIN
tara:strand:+ start:98 stop:301 length:204 start_codon:yes stop_codon:yes gene_type:complete